MGCWKKIKEILAGFDIFSQSVSFRFRDQPNYQSATGGFVSLVIIIVFMALFAGTGFNTITKQKISFSKTQFQETIPSYFNTSADSDFMFAVRIQHLDMNQGMRYFDVVLQKKHYSVLGRVNTTIQLTPCHLSQWGNINRQLGKIYDRLNLNQWLCPPQHLVLQLQGKPTSQVFSFYQFQVRKCNSSLVPSRPCATSIDITNFLAIYQTFNFNFYFVNKILNPDNQTYISLFLDDVNYFAFSDTIGVNGNIFVNAFSIQTDQSIIPFFEQFTNVKGGLVSEKAQLYNYAVTQDIYVRVNLRKSSISFKINRTFYAMDDFVSYIGGLFSAIITALLVLSLFNEFSYELQMAKILYHDNKNQPIDSQGFHIFVFFGYCIFLLFDKISVTLPWQKMQNYHNTLQQVRKQMDIRLVMKKIQFNQRVNHAMIEQRKLLLLQCQEPLTLQEVQKHRQDYLIYKKIRKHLSDKGIFDFSSLEDVDSEGESSMNQIIKNNQNIGQNDIGIEYNGQTLEKKEQKLTDQEKQKRQVKRIFRRLKRALIHLEEDIKAEKNLQFQTNKNIMEKIDSKIIKKFKKTQKLNNIRFSLENNNILQLQAFEGNSQIQNPSPKRKKRQANQDEYFDG